MGRKVGVQTLKTHPSPAPRLRIKWGQESLNLLIPTLFHDGMRKLEMEQDPSVLTLHLPIISSACLLSVESFSQRISLIREVRNVEPKESGQRRLNNNDVVTKHSEGPLVLPQGL